MDPVEVSRQPLLVAACSQQRPYAKAISNGSTIDGQTKTYCTLNYTTCAAIEQKNHGYKTNCGVNAGGNPVTTGATGGRSDLCGAQGVNDGFCVNIGPGDYRCTVPCSPASDTVTRLAPDCPDLPTNDPICQTQTSVEGTSTLFCTL